MQADPSYDTDGHDDRVELVEHLNWILRPPLARWFIDQVVEAIEFAGAGDDDRLIEVDLRRYRVSEVIRLWELEELVERAKAGEFKPVGGERSWVYDCLP